MTVFNDLAVTPEGGLLVGALHFSPFAGESPLPGALRYVGPDGAARVWHTGVVWPNGIGFSPDGAALEELVVTTMDYTADPAAAGSAVRGPAPVPGAPVPRFLG